MYGFTYTTQGAMTAADLDEIRADMDLNPEPITLADLARELGAQPHEVYAFGNLDEPYTTDDMLISAEDADAIREAWSYANGPKYPAGTPEYEAYAAELRAEFGQWVRREPPYN